MLVVFLYKSLYQYEPVHVVHLRISNTNTKNLDWEGSKDKKTKVSDVSFQTSVVLALPFFYYMLEKQKEVER